MDDRKIAISDLDASIRWIEDIRCHQFPGWLNVTISMRRALELLKEQDNCENCAIAIEDRQPVVRCKDCINCVKEPNGELYCDILAVGYEPLGSKKVNGDWFCADGERR